MLDRQSRDICFFFYLLAGPSNIKGLLGVEEIKGFRVEVRIGVPFVTVRVKVAEVGNELRL